MLHRSRGDQDTCIAYEISALVKVAIDRRSANDDAIRKRHDLHCGA